MVKTRLYGIQIVNQLTSKVMRLDLEPMTHKEACTLKSKMSKHSWRRIELFEVSQRNQEL